MTTAELIVLVVQASILLLVFELGLHATLADATSLLRRPGLLLRSLVAMNVVVPFCAALLAATFALHFPVKVALLLLSLSPVPPILPGKQLRLGGSASYIYGLLVAAALCSIVLAPLGLQILAWIFDREAQTPAGVIAKVVFTSVIVPLGVGMAVRHFASAFAARIAPMTARVGMMLLVGGLLPILVSAWPGVVSLVGNGTIVAITAVILVGLFAGHALGGPEPEDRAVLAIASSMRHPGVALAIAKGLFPEEKLVFAAVLLFAVVNLIVTIPYVAWCKRRVVAVAGGEAAARR